MLTSLLLALLLSVFPMTAVPSAHALTAATPAVNPVTEATAPLALDIVEMTPEVLTESDTLQVRVRLTNQGDEALSDVGLELRAPLQRITAREDLQAWQSRTDPHTLSPVRATSGTVNIAPGQSIELSVSATAQDLRFDADPSLWGARRVSITARSGEEALTSLRTFTVWWPEGSAAAMQQPLRSSVLMPVWTPRPGQALLEPDDFAVRAEEGRLSAVTQLAQRDDVDWVLDPSLLTPPRQLRVTSEGTEEPSASPAPSTPEASDGGGEGTAPSPDADASASATPTEFVVQPNAAAVRDELRGSIGERTILGVPYAGADLAAIREAGDERLREQADTVTREAWEAADVQPRSQVAVIPGDRVTPDAVTQAQAAGAQAVIVPQGSVRADPNAAIRPSGATRITLENGTPITAITPDSSLSREFSVITGETDVEQSRQRVLAETAVLAGENLPVQRQVVILPQMGDNTDADAVSAVLDAMGAAPWMNAAPVGSLLDEVENGRTTEDALDPEGRMFAIGEVPVQDVRPAVIAEDGTVRNAAPRDSPPPLDRGLLDSLDSTLAALLEQRMAMEDPAATEAPLALALASVSEHHRTDRERQDALAAASHAGMQEVGEQIHITPASGYNLVSGSAGVPITVSNALGTPIHVTVHARTDRQVARFGAPVTLTIPAYSQEEATIPVQAVANGSVELTTTLTAEGSSTPLVDPVTVPLTVNPAWENWTTMLLVAAMGVLVVGIFRARRTGSDRRAPAQLGPEGPYRSHSTDEETQ